MYSNLSYDQNELAQVMRVTLYAPFTSSNHSRDQNELAQVMRVTYDELIDFVTTPEFSAVMEEFGLYR